MMDILRNVKCPECEVLGIVASWYWVSEIKLPVLKIDSEEKMYVVLCVG